MVKQKTGLSTGMGATIDDSGGNIQASGGVTSTHVVGNEITFSGSDIFVRRLSNALPGDIVKIASSQIELLGNYYNAVLGQANTSFRWAIVAAASGLALFVAAAIVSVLYSNAQGVAIVGVIGGTIVEVISGINFFLYGKTTAQLSHFHQTLDQTQRFLLANSICEALEGDVKQEVRAQLVNTIATLKLELPKQLSSNKEEQ